MEYTEKEKLVLKAITEDCFYEQGWESTLWVDSFLSYFNGLSDRATGAILGSLAKKEAIYVGGGDKNSKVIVLRPKGIEYLKTLGTLDEFGHPKKD